MTSTPGWLGGAGEGVTFSLEFGLGVIVRVGVFGDFVVVVRRGLETRGVVTGGGSSSDSAPSGVTDEAATDGAVFVLFLLGRDGGGAGDCSSSDPESVATSKIIQNK